MSGLGEFRDLRQNPMVREQEHALAHLWYAIEGGVQNRITALISHFP